MIKANHPERGQTEFTQKMWDALGSNKQGWVQGVEKPAEIVDFEIKQLDVMGARDTPSPLVIYGAIETQELFAGRALEVLLPPKRDDPAPPAVNPPLKAKRKRKTK